MDPQIRAFGNDLGRKILACDWHAVHQLLAPWLRDTTPVDEVRGFFESEYRLTLGENGIVGIRYPESREPQLDGDETATATSLRAPIDFLGGKRRALPPDVTDQNFSYYLRLAMPCSEEQAEHLPFDTFCELWVAVVRTEEGLRVGYWSQGQY